MFTRNFIRILSSLVVICLFAGISYAATYYVSPTGAATWVNCSGTTPLNGTSACSWQTAMANAVAGDIVYFREGIYEPGEANQFGDPVMRPAHNGTEGNPITFKGYLGEIATIRDAIRTGVVPPANNTGTAAGCFQNSYIVWDGFTLDRVNNNGYQASAIVRFEMSHHCTITNSNLIGRPQLDQYNGSLIHIIQSSYIYITNNKLHGMSCGVTPYSTCVNATAVWSFDFDHVYINNNDIYDNNNALSSKIGTSYLYIYNNHIWNSPRAAINYIPQIEGTTDALIYQNVIRNSGPALYSPDAYRPHYNLKFYNNTIYNAFATTLATIGNGTYTNSRNAEVFNNIISVGGTTSIFERFGNGVDKPAYADYNNFFGIGTWRVAYSATYNTLADWQAVMNLDINSITSDPQFVNAGGSNPEDYKLQPNSPARIGRGGAYATVMGAYITGDETIGYDPDAPRVEITSPPSSTVTTSNPSITISGTATDTVGIVSVTWSNDRGGSGVAWSGAATQNVNWSVSNIPLQNGQNIITVTARDGDNKTGVDTVVVNPTTPSGGGGNNNSGDNNSSATGGSGCGYITGKGQKTKGEGIALITMLIISFFGISIIKILSRKGFKI